MALVPGLVAVFRIVALGDVAPAGSLVEEMLEESLRGGHPAGAVRSGGFSSQSLAAWPSRQPGARCFSSSLTPPQDRENCHAGGNVFVPFDGFAPVTLCNLYLHLSNNVPFLFYEENDQGYRGVQRVTILEYA